MKRSYRTVLGLFACAACSETATLAERPHPASPAPAPAHAAETPDLALLATVARPGRPSGPVRIVEPRDGAEVDEASASGLAVRVQGPAGKPGSPASLVISLDGARPRPVIGEALGLADLVDTGAPLERGAHDLVLAAVGPDGLALEPSADSIASARFFVGPRPSAPPARRLVCLSPFGTYYGRAPSITLDFVLVPRDAAAAAPLPRTMVSAGPERRAKAVGLGPFALGDFAPGDHVLTLSPAPGGPAALPGRCVFAYNPEIERSP